MPIAAKILIVGGILNLAYGFLTGFFFAQARRKSPNPPRYLVAAHIGPLMQGPMLLSLVFAVELSPLSHYMETFAASLLVGSSVLIAARDTLNWIQGVKDEFQQRPRLARALIITGIIAAVPGLCILIFGVFLGL